MSAPHVIAPPLPRAIARLDLVLGRLAKAKNADPMNVVPIATADAEALHAIVWAALEDLGALAPADVRKRA
jgi:hypothetical protein